MNRLIATPLATVAFSLALVACGETVEEETVVADTEVAADEFDPLNRDYVLSAEAQERRDAFDAAAFDTEYRGYRDEIRSEPDDEGIIEADGGTVTVESTGSNTSTTVNGEDARPIGARTPGTNMRSRRDMSWSYLDRNSDGQLTVAEYAIWAIPLTPRSG